MTDQEYPNSEAEFEAMLAKTTSQTSYAEREERTNKLLSDPKPEYAPPVKKNYPTTEFHYIVCVDADFANESLPEAARDYGSPHKVGGILVSDRLELPMGFIQAPKKGTSIETIKDDYPELYTVMNDKKITEF